MAGKSADADGARRETLGPAGGAAGPRWKRVSRERGGAAGLPEDSRGVGEDTPAGVVGEGGRGWTAGEGRAFCAALDF